MRALVRLAERMRRPPRRAKEVVYLFTRFPMYAMTFVFQEIQQLKRRGLPVSLVTLQRGPKEDLHEQFGDLWELIEEIASNDPDEHLRNYHYFLQRFPERVRHLASRFGASHPGGSDPFTSDCLLPAFTIARQLLDREVGYLHSHFTYRDSTLAFIVGRLLEVPRGLTVHADCFVESPFKLLQEQLDESDLIVTLSQQAADYLRGLGGDRNAGKFVLKRNGVDVRRFRRLAPPASRTRIVSVSRIARKKGLIYLVKACRLLLDRGWQVRCDIIGQPDPANPDDLLVMEELTDAIERFRLGAAVQLLGKLSRERIMAHLLDCSIFAAPYVVTEDGRREVTPTSIIEAMALELVPVTTDSGAIPELVQHNHNGLLVPQRDERALADAIEALFRDERLFDRLRRAARATVESRFDLERNEVVFERAVRRLLRNGATMASRWHRTRS
jgi:glycosyltransferase involved in cell wall biosynthesis